jgi:exopolysaccharide biosynthesis polyprenyl glycosylphosphotransferase
MVYTLCVKRLDLLFAVLRVPCDAAAVITALLLAYLLRVESMDLVPWVQLLESPTTLPSFGVYVLEFALPGTGLYLLTAALFNLYSDRPADSAWREIGQICTAAAAWLVIIMVWYFFLRKQLFYSRILLLHATALLTLLVISLRAGLILAYRALLRRGYGRRAVLTIGRPLPSVTLDALHRELSYAYLGHVRTFAEFQKRARTTAIDLVIETSPNPDDQSTLALIDFCRSRHVGYAFLPPVFADAPHLLGIDHLGLLPLVRFRPTPLDGWGMILKRLFDTCLAAVLIVVLLPVLALIALVILLESGRPVLYVSRRSGQHDRIIPVLKFRSMVHDADAQKARLRARNHRRDGPLFKVVDDPRVTRIGRILRRWSLDELPQLFNVVLGHLALVGPRPHLPSEVEHYSDRERRVFAVKPGVTGLAQVSGRSDLTFQEEIRLDLQYIEEWSLRLDLWVLWRTLVVVLSRKGAD